MYVVFFLCMQISIIHAKEIFDSIVAVVNDDVILKSDLINVDKRLISNYNYKNNCFLNIRDIYDYRLLNSLIVNKIYAQEANKINIKVDNYEIDNLIFLIANRNNLTIDQFRKTLKLNGISFKDYKKFVYQEKMIEKIYEFKIFPRVTLFSKEIDLFIKNINVSIDTNCYFDLSYIFIPLDPGSNYLKTNFILNLVDLFHAKICNGEKFEDLIKFCYKFNFLNVGKLNKHKLNEFPDVLYNHIKYINKGEVIGPIFSEFGFYFLKIDDISNNINEITEKKIFYIFIKSVDKSDKLVVDKQNGFKKINGILEEINKNKISFIDAIRKYSQDFNNDLNVKNFELKKNDKNYVFFSKILKNLQMNEISKPFYFKNGWYLFTIVNDEKYDLYISSKKKEIYEKIIQDRLDKENTLWLQEQIENSYIKIF